MNVQLIRDVRTEFGTSLSEARDLAQKYGSSEKIRERLGKKEPDKNDPYLNAIQDRDRFQRKASILSSELQFIADHSDDRRIAERANLALGRALNA